MTSSGLNSGYNRAAQLRPLMEPGSLGHPPTLITDKGHHRDFDPYFSNSEFGAFCDAMDEQTQHPFYVIMEIIGRRNDADLRVSPKRNDDHLFSQEFVDLLQKKDLTILVDTLHGVYERWDKTQSKEYFVALQSLLSVILNTIYYARTCSMFYETPRGNPPPLTTELYHLTAVDIANLGGEQIREQGVFRLEMTRRWRDD